MREFRLSEDTSEDRYLFDALQTAIRERTERILRYSNTDSSHEGGVGGILYRLEAYRCSVQTNFVMVFSQPCVCH